MKLLIYGINFAPELTGIGKYVGEMAFWLADRGHSVTVVTAAPHYPQWKTHAGYSAARYRREHVAGVRVIRCPVWIPTKLTGFSRVVHLASFAASSFFILLWRAWRDKPDVIIGIEPPFFGAPATMIAGRLSGSKTWLHIQDFELDAAFELGFLRGAWLKRAAARFERAVMRRFDRVSTISERMMERLSAKGVAAGHRFLFPNWVDADTIFPHERCNTFRKTLGLSGEDTVVLYSGNMGRKQGLELIIEAAKALHGSSRIHFVMCGDGSMRPLLQALAHRQPNVHWLPLQPTDRFNELLSMADIHVLTQRTNTGDCFMPSKLSAMMANGRPVIATADPHSPVAQVVKECGEVVPPGDRAELVRAIVKLAADAERRQKLGDAARQYAVTHWHKETILRSFENALRESVPRPGAPK